MGTKYWNNSGMWDTSMWNHEFLPILGVGLSFMDTPVRLKKRLSHISVTNSIVALFICSY